MDQRQDGNLKGGVLQPHQAGCQEGQVAFRPQLFPSPRLHLELRRLSPSKLANPRDQVSLDLIHVYSQTWEDPFTTHPETKARGDNDPLDVCEIGEQVGYVGQVKQVKVLGIMALLDEGETDWKVIVVDVLDPLASKLNDIEDVERHLPGLIRATNEWFR